MSKKTAKSKQRYSKQMGFEAVASSLRQFGYPDATAEMVADVWAAMEGGKLEDEMPHGIIGRFAWRQLDDVRDTFKKLPEAQ